MTQSSRQIDCTSTDLNNTDIVVLDHHQLDDFIETIGGPNAIPEHVTVFTDDGYTRGTVKFNLIVFNDDGTYGIATQLHNPFTANDIVRDLRHDVSPSFVEYLVGLL